MLLSTYCPWSSMLKKRRATHRAVRLELVSCCILNYYSNAQTRNSEWDLQVLFLYAFLCGILENWTSWYHWVWTKHSQKLYSLFGLFLFLYSEFFQQEEDLAFVYRNIVEARLVAAIHTLMFSKQNRERKIIRSFTSLGVPAQSAKQQILMYKSSWGRTSGCSCPVEMLLKREFISITCLF